MGLGGLEPPTSPLSGARSSHLSYRPIQTFDETAYGFPILRRVNFVRNRVQTPYLCTRLQWTCHFALLFMRKGRVVAGNSQTGMFLWLRRFRKGWETSRGLAHFVADVAARRGQSILDERRLNKCSSIRGRIVGHRLGAMPPRSGTKSELEAQTELHDARIVRPIQYQEPAASRVGRCRQSLRRRATHRAGSSGATHTWICAADGIELRVIEGIKGFPAEFEGVPFLEFESFEQSHIKVQAARHAQHVAGGIAECKTDGNVKRSGVVVQLAKGSCSLECLLHGCRNLIGIAHHVRVRACSDSIGHASIVGISRAIAYCKRYSGLSNRDARPLPPAQERVLQPGVMLEKR